MSSMVRRSEKELVPMWSVHETIEPVLRKKMANSRIDPQTLAAIGGALVTISYGFHTGWPSPSLAKLLAADSDIPVTSRQGAWITGFLSLGCVSGILCMPHLCDHWGRKAMLLGSSFPYLLSCVLIAVAQNYAWFYVARYMAGFGLGLSGSVAALYITEISEDKSRGSLGTLNNNLTMVGMVIASCVGIWVDRLTLAMVGASIPIISGLVVPWIPETPYFLVMKKRRSDAEKSLTWLRRSKDVSAELAKIELSVEYDQRNASSVRELVGTSTNRRALFVAVGLFIAQEFSGYLAVVSYSTLIFQASGAKVSANLSVVIVAVIQLFSGFIAIFLADRVGRRPLLLVSATGSIVFLSGEALYFQLLDAGIDVTPIYWLPTVAIVGFVAFYTIGLGLLPVCICSELFPCNLRTRGAMVCMISAMVSIFIVTQLYQIVADTYGVQYSFWMFDVITVFSLIFIYFLVPETKNRTVREIHSEWERIYSHSFDEKIIEK